MNYHLIAPRLYFNDMPGTRRSAAAAFALFQDEKKTPHDDRLIVSLLLWFFLKEEFKGKGLLVLTGWCNNVKPSTFIKILGLFWEKIVSLMNNFKALLSVGNPLVMTYGWGTHSSKKKRRTLLIGKLHKSTNKKNKLNSAGGLYFSINIQTFFL